MSIDHNLSTSDFEPRRADELQAGDQVLCKFYDANGEWSEQLWIATSVQVRRYGKGSRVIVCWAYNGGQTTPKSYKPDVEFGVAKQKAASDA